MRKTIVRCLSLVLAVVLAFGTLPMFAFAADPTVSEDRALNSLVFPGMRIWDVFLGRSTGAWYYVPFDAASGYPLFCVDPGVNASTDPNNYTVTIANGKGVLSLIEQAKNTSLLGSADSNDHAGDFLTNSGLSIDVLETLDESVVTTIMQLISVLYMHRGDPTYMGNASTNYQGFNLYAIYAVQNYIWHCCSSRSKDPWHAISDLSDQGRKAIQQLFYMMVEEIGELYGGSDPVPTSITFDNGLITRETAEEAQSAAYPFYGGTTTFAPFTNEDKDDLSKIHYIAINGGNVQVFEPGSSATYNSFTITRGADDTITVEIAGDDTDTYTVQFLTTQEIPTASGTSSGSQTVTDPYPFELPIEGSTGYALIDIALQAGDSASSATISTVAAGTPYLILEEGRNSFRVRLENGREGWIDKDYTMVNLPDVIPSIIYNATNSYSSLLLLYHPIHHRGGGGRSRRRCRPGGKPRDQYIYEH